MKDSLVQEFMERLNNQLPSLKEHERLFNSIYSLVEKNESDKHTKKFLKKKLKELSELAEVNTEEVIMNLSLKQIKRKELLLEKFQAEDGYEAIAKVVGAMNRQYNPKDTDYSRYLDLRVQLLDYCAKNRKEMKGLAELSYIARRYRAYVLAGEMEKYQIDLSKEEKDLHILVETLNPENQNIERDKASRLSEYCKIAQYLQKKVSLYEEKGRIELLGAYQRFLKDYDDSSSMKMMWIETTNRYLCSKKPTLAEQTQAAQSLRKPVRGRLNETERNKPEIHRF